MAPEPAAARARRGLSTRRAGAGEWRAFHLYHHGGLDAVLDGLVQPLVRGLLAEGRVSAFHHYRYDLGGPHVRLRVRLGADGAPIEARVRSAAAAFFATHPSPARVPDDVVLERNRTLVIGNEANRPWLHAVFPPDCVDERPWSPGAEPLATAATLQPVLDLFTASSIQALGWPMPDAPGARLPQVGRLLVRQAWGLAADPGEFVRTLAYATPFGGEAAEEVARLAEQAFERGADALCELLRQELAALAERPAPAQPAAGYLLADASRAFARETAREPTERRYGHAGRQMHMTANRCGLGNREEAYLARMLVRAAERLAAARAAEWDAVWRARARQAQGPSLAEVVRRGTAAFVAGEAA